MSKSSGNTEPAEKKNLMLYYMVRLFEGPFFSVYCIDRFFSRVLPQSLYSLLSPLACSYIHISVNLISVNVYCSKWHKILLTCYYY